MIEFLPESTDHVVGIRFTSTQDRHSYRDVLGPRIESLLQRYATLRVLILMDESFEGWTFPRHGPTRSSISSIGVASTRSRWSVPRNGRNGASKSPPRCITHEKEPFAMATTTPQLSKDFTQRREGRQPHRSEDH